MTAGSHDAVPLGERSNTVRRKNFSAVIPVSLNLISRLGAQRAAASAVRADFSSFQGLTKLKARTIQPDCSNIPAEN